MQITNVTLKGFHSQMSLFNFVKLTGSLDDLFRLHWYIVYLCPKRTLKNAAYS